MSSIPTRQLGKAGPKIPAMGLGLMGLSIAYGSVDSDEARFQLLDRAHELGSTFWDSADAYGDSEDLIGKWFHRTGKRDDIFLATKFSISYTATGISWRSDPEYVREACDKSLKRLGVDCIDLYYCHRVDMKTPIEKTVEAMAQLKKEGKIKYLGLSEISSATLRRACAVHHIDAVQIEYSPFAMEIEDPAIALLETCRDLGVAVVAYSPLGRGFLTGAYASRADFEANDYRLRSPRFSEENFPSNLQLVADLQRLAQHKGCTAGQLCLAWLLAQGDDIFPIPGTKKVKYLDENMAAINVALSPHELAEIRQCIAATKVQGARYPEAMTANLFGDTPALESG